MLPPAGTVLAFGEEFARRAFYTMVQRSGIEKVQSCSSCHDVLLLLNQSARRWNLLILDSGIPRAFETIQTLRRRIGPHLKILMVFSGPTREKIQEAVEAGVDDVVIFPVSQATLEKKLAGLVDLRQDKITLFKRINAPSANILPSQN